MASAAHLLVVTFLSVLNSNNVMPVTGQQMSPCELAQCVCLHTAPPAGNNDSSTGARNPSLIVTCQISVVSSRSRTLQSLNPNNIKSLTLICERDYFFSHLDKGALSKFSLIESLTIDNCFIKSFDPFFLSEFANLQVLIFRNVSVDPMKISFASKSLKRLSVINSKLKTIPYFFDLPSLEKLNISYNYVSDSKMEFSEYNDSIILHHMTSLSAEGSDISFISPIVFGAMPYLTDVLLSNNGLDRLSFPDNFSFPHLEVFECFGNPLKHVDTDVLGSSMKLKRLQLEGVGVPIDVTFLASLHNLQVLQMSNFDLDSSLWEFLPSTCIVKLDLSSNRLDSINLTSFSALRLLHLQENFISDLSPDSFRDQPGLQRVNLTLNNISKIPESIFVHNRDIKAILFAHNNIEELPANVFSRNPEIFYIDFNDNGIRDLPDTIFMPLHKLRFLYLKRNKLVSFPSFPSPCALENLYISHNAISSLHPSKFTPLKDLQLLEANHNRIRTIPHGTLSSCPHLVIVYLQNNQIWGLDSLEDLLFLEYIDLQDNQLTHRYLKAFSRMRNLHYLYLDSNRITRIPPHSFPRSILIVTLSDNSLTYIRRDAFSDLPNLTHVSLMRNKMVLTIPQASLSVFKKNIAKPVFFLDFTVLHCTCDMAYLKVWSNQQAKNNLDALFYYNYPTFSGLEHTYCASDFFPEVERPFLQVPIDQFVCNNTGGYICDVFCTCCPVESCPCLAECPDGCACYQIGSTYNSLFNVIECDRRGLTSIPSKIYGWVIKFQLDGNHFENISSSPFKNLTTLNELALNASHISNIVDGSFQYMSRLQILRLNDNRVGKIGIDMFGNMPSLRELYLNGNRIQVIEMKAFDGLTSLKILHLATNELTSLGSILDLPSLQSVTLAFNPWSCVCADGWETVRYLYTLPSLIKDKNQMCCDDSMPLNFTHEEYALSHSLSNSTDLPQEQSPVPGHLKNLESASGELLNKKASPENVGGKSTGFSHLDFELNKTQRTESGSQEGTCFLMFRMSFNLMCTERYHNDSGHPVNRDDNRSASLMAPLISLAVLLTLVAAVVVFVLWKRSVVQAWVYAKVGVRIWDTKAAVDKEDNESNPKPFDVFISFSQKDVGFVVNRLVPTLEEKRFRVCVHYRDFPVGGDICAVIQRAIRCSSRTLLVVSQNFLKSDWCRFEFQTAHHHVLKKGCHRLIIVVLGELEAEDVDPDLRTQMKTKTYLSAEDPWFWEKLYFALPDIDGRQDDQQPALKGLEILSKAADDDDVILEEKHEKLKPDKDALGLQENCAYDKHSQEAFSAIDGNGQENGGFNEEENGVFGKQYYEAFNRYKGDAED